MRSIDDLLAPPTLRERWHDLVGHPKSSVTDKADPNDLGWRCRCGAEFNGHTERRWRLHP